MNNPKVNAVVVTYNRKKMLVECLNAVLNQTFPVEKITLVDNASTDETKKYLKQKGLLNNPKLRYIRLKENLGGAGGFYYGLKLSQGQGYDWAWVMDDDVIPEKNSLKELIISLNNLSKEKISFLASSVYGKNGEFMNVPTINEFSEKNGYPSWYKYLDEGIVSIKAATFVSLLINYDAISSVGLPIKDYFIWGDDSEYTQRLVTFYGKAFFVGKSKVLHKRINAKSLSIFNFDDKNRLKMVWRMYRNNLINIHFYQGKKAFFKSIIKDVGTIFKCIGNNNSFIMINQIVRGDTKGILEYRKYKKYIKSQLSGTNNDNNTK